MNRMKLLAATATAAVAAVAAVAMPASAGNGLHWYQGQTPVITLSGNTVTETGQVAGAGQFVNVTLSANYTYPVSCFNPGSDAGPVPGQSQSGSASTSKTVQAIHGNADVSTSLTVQTPTAPKNACPNGKWTAVAGPLTISSATLTVTSNPNGSLTFTQTF